MACLLRDHNYQQLTSNILNKILHQTCVLSSEYLLRRTNEKADGENASKYKVVQAFYADRTKSKHDKKKNS